MAGQKQVDWLRGEIEQWAREGLLNESQKATLLERYPARAAGTAWGTILFSSLGAVIAGLGIILLLAYNWDAIGKIEKLALVAGSVLIAHIVGLKLFWDADRRRPLGEGICLLGSMLFGAGIWLVAQIYHINEHFPNAFLIWGLGCMTLAAAMPSIPQAMLGTVLISIWAGAERAEFGNPMYLAPLLVALVAGTLAYARRSRLLLAVVIPAFYLTYGFALPRGGSHPWLVLSVLLSLSAVMIAKSYLVRKIGRFPQAATVLAVYGWTLFAGVLYLMSFPGLAREFFDWERHALRWQHLVYWFLPLAACALNWTILTRDRARGAIEPREGGFGWEIMLVPLTVVVAMADVFYLRHFGNWMVAGPFNLVLIGLAASRIATGCRNGLLQPTIVGSVLLVLVIVARYFDLFDSLLLRGAAFVGMGGLLLAEGILYSRARKQRTTGGAA